MTDTQPAREKAKSVLGQAEDVVRHNPLLAVGTLLSVGLVLGYSLKAGSRPPRRLDRLQRLAGTDYRSRDLERAIDRMETVINRSVPRAYETVRDKVSDWPEIVTTLTQLWQNKAVPKLEEARNAIPNVSEIKSAVSNASAKWTK